VPINDRSSAIFPKGSSRIFNRKLSFVSRGFPDFRFNTGSLLSPRVDSESRSARSLGAQLTARVGSYMGEHTYGGGKGPTWSNTECLPLLAPSNFIDCSWNSTNRHISAPFIFFDWAGGKSSYLSSLSSESLTAYTCSRSREKYYAMNAKNMVQRTFIIVCHSQQQVNDFFWAF
jgi:hypothetical protein